MYILIKIHTVVLLVSLTYPLLTTWFIYNFQQHFSLLFIIYYTLDILSINTANISIVTNIMSL